jgi:excisionase family DNA binding protein
MSDAESTQASRVPAPTPAAASPAAPPLDTHWVPNSAIAEIPGALKPSAYVARAYHHLQHHREPPPWARKLPNGHWLFDEAYVKADAALNATTLGVSEAAKLLGVTRRAVQTWVDEGRIPSLRDQRQKGEIRRIPRDEFVRLIPSLQVRLPAEARTAPATASAPPASPDELRQRLEAEAAAEERRLANHVEQELQELAATRERLTRERDAVGRRLQELERAELRARERATRLRAGYQQRLDDARHQAQEADRQRAAAAREAQRMAREQERLATRANQLQNRMVSQIDAWRRRSAAAIAAQIREAARLWNRPPAPPTAPTSPPAHEAARRSAAAVASQLHRARDERQRLGDAETRAIQLADHWRAEIAAGRVDRYDAAIRFHQDSEPLNIPDDIRIDIMKRYFSK